MNDSDSAVSSAAIEEALTAVRANVARLGQERGELDKQILGGREEEKLLARLLAIRRGEAPTMLLRALATDGTGEQRSDREGVDSLLSAVIEELNSAGRPIHISELMRL